MTENRENYIERKEEVIVCNPINFSFSDAIHDAEKIHSKKRDDYGDSFQRSLRKYGDVSFLTVMSHKFDRLNNLLLTGKKPQNESVLDTVIDMAVYSLMYYTEKKK